MTWNLILADPPWRQQKGGKRSARPNQTRELDYPTLSLENISEHIAAVPAEESTSLWLWTIDKYLFEAEQLAKNLGYKLHARIIWNKFNGVAPAFTIRYSHEYLLWMYKGKMLPVETSMRGKFTTVLEEKSTTHSTKPVAAYELIEALYPNSKKIELYARNVRKGWDVFGNEVESTWQPPQ